MVQNAAARPLTGTKKYDHVIPILASLHWLLIYFRIQFKILLFVFKALNDQAPLYIRDILTPLSSTRYLDRALFRAQLPLDTHLAPSTAIFKSKLKTFISPKLFLSVLFFVVIFHSVQYFG